LATAIGDDEAAGLAPAKRFERTGDLGKLFRDVEDMLRKLELD